jgi:hypothetical protein
MKPSGSVAVEIPVSLAQLRAKLEALPAAIRDELRGLTDEAIEDSVFRGRVLAIAKDGLERYRLDLAMAQFDLEATRREREVLRRKLEGMGV